MKTFIDYNQKFDEIQNRYFEKKDKKVLGEMYLLLKEYAFKRIGIYEKKKHCRIPDIEEKSNDIADEIIILYLKYPDYRIQKISTYIYFPLHKILFANKEYEMKSYSLTAFEEEENRNDNI